jgi:hypothetical protein
MLPRDAVLEGVRPIEVEALTRLSADPEFRPGADIVRRLEAKGWLESFGEAHLITVTGRTLLERH